MDYAVFSTRLGWMAVARTTHGLARVALPAPDAVSALDALCLKTRTPPSRMREAEAGSFGSLPERLAAFMSGEKVDFDDIIDRTAWTDFRTRIWEATRRIPYGETRSYAWVAAKAGQPAACRAAGQALHNNPVPILVPCHRVIGAGGALVGFGSGLKLKQMLLSLECRTPGISGDAVR